MDMNRCGFALWTALAVLASSPAFAQNATVRGSVANAQGGALANAEVTLRTLPPPGMPARMPNMPGMAADERTTRSAADGTFSFDQVRPGQYVLFADSPGYERSSQEVTVANQPQTLALRLQPLEVPGAETSPAAGAAGGQSAAEVQALIDRIKALEQRITDLESTTVLSEPETRPKRIEVYVDKNGNESEEPTPGATKKVTYQRERVYRRQTINEKIEQALTDQSQKTIAVGVSAASVTQFAQQTRGDGTAEADGHAYQLTSGDLLFAAGVAQYTSFFADIVGLSGAPPDAEIQGLTLLNSYTARLVRQNEVNVREAWVRTEFFSQKLAISAGRLDLTNYFDRNAFANDETSQFISDALVNNPALGLAVNGAGVAGVFDPKNGFALKAGFQQSSNEATNLSESLYTLIEGDYVARPRGLSEGAYRVWWRNDNSSGVNRSAVGLSADQKLTNMFGIFGRYGTAETDGGRDHFYSLGFQVQNAAVFNPLDYWGFGYAQTNLEAGDHERIVEGYYNFKLSEKLRLSLHLAHTFIAREGSASEGFLVPAIRLQARF
jgi:Carboxypeptidase regulatory-like domain